MARIRTIKPAFFTDDELAEVPPLGRILFIGLWTLADCEGRLECRPKRLKAELLPYDDCDIVQLLNELEQRGFIHRYTSDVSECICIPKFRKHQRITGSEADTTSELPECGHGCNREAPRKQHGSTEETLRKHPGRQERKGREGKENPPIPPEGFERFYAAYPKKKSKGDAEKAWKALKPNDELQAVILAAIESAKQSADWTKNGGQFIPYPASWLRDKGWEDEYQPRLPISNGYTDHHDDLNDPAIQALLAVKAQAEARHAR